MEQLTHHNTVFKHKKFPITVICDEVYFQQNIGSIFRICDAFGVEKIIFTGENFIFSERKINKTSRSTHKSISYEILKNKNKVVNFFSTKDYQIIALEITKSSIPLTQLEIDNQKPIALLIGNEIDGVSKELLSLAPVHIHVNMYGKNSSMNVVQSLSIALFHITNLL